MYLFINGWAADASVWESLHPGEDCRFLEFSAGLEPGGVVREAAALAAEHGPLEVIGWSMGGMLALELAAQAPELVARLTLIDSTARFTAAADYAGGLPRAIVRQLARRVKRDAIRAQLDFYRQMFSPEESTLAGAFCRRGAMVQDTAALLAGLAYLEEQDLRELLPRIACQVRVIHGAEDAVCPLAAGEYLAEHLPQSELICLPGCGHVPFYTQPALCRKLIWEGAASYGG